MCEADEGTSLKREGSEVDGLSTDDDSFLHWQKIITKKIPKMGTKKFLCNLFY